MNNKPITDQEFKDILTEAGFTSEEISANLPKYKEIFLGLIITNYLQSLPQNEQEVLLAGADVSNPDGVKKIAEKIDKHMELNAKNYKPQKTLLELVKEIKNYL